MSRAAVLVSFLSASLLTGPGTPLIAQAPPPMAPPSPPMSLAPPVVPGAGAAPIIPVAPPLPGELQASPAMPPPAPGTLPPSIGPLPSPAPAASAPAAASFNSAPSVPLNRSKVRSSTSTSGQFIVHGDDLTLRSALSSKCEDISKELATLLHDKQAWTLPIVVLLSSGEAARKADKTVSTVISQLTHGGFHIQVNVNMRPDLRPSDLRREVVRALLAERILRDRKEITTQRKLLLPDWFFLGVIEALDYRQRARPSTLFAAIFKSGKIFGIEEIIEASSSDIDDALSKTIYQTSCCALVLALLDQPDSGLRVGKFLNALASDPRTERELLNQWFPNLATTEASLNKWWALQMATLASPGMAEPLSPQDTVTALEEAITFHYQGKASEIPQTSRRVVAAVKPAASRPAPDTAETKEEPATVPPTEEHAKRGFMSRLNPFSRSKSSDDEIADAIEEAARAEAGSANASSMPENLSTLPAPGADAPPEVPTTPVPASGSTKRKPLLDRWFDDENKKAPEAPKTDEKPAEKPDVKKAEDKPAPAPPAKPKPVSPPPAKASKKETPQVPPPKEEPAAAPEPEAEKKPSTLNPLNWFRGGKKDKEAKPESLEEAPPAAEKDDKNKKAFHSPQADPLATELLTGGPIVALVFQEVAVEAEEPAPGEKKRFLGLFGKKKDKAENDPAEPEAPKTPAAPKETKKETAKTKETPPAPEPSKEDKKKAAAEEKPEAPAPEETATPDTPKPKRAPVRLRLFGSDKKDEEPKEPEAKPEMPAEAPPAAEPKREPPSRPKPVAAKPASPKNETATTAAAIPIEDYAAILKRKDLDQIMERNVNALGALQNRASILFRPIVMDYMTAMEDIHKGKTKGLDARLRALRTRTQEALEKTHAIRDLLDVHEANGAPAMSGLFEDYLKLPETIQNELPQRTDPISKYLDALDKEFMKE